MPRRRERQRQSRMARVASGPELSFGSRLKELRKGADLSIRELARRSDVGETTIQKYEVGHSLPGISELRKFSQALGVSVQFLVFGDELHERERPASAPSFFDTFSDEEYIARLGAAMLALPQADRFAMQQVLESLLTAKLGADRLERLKMVAANWLTWLTVDAAAGDRLPEQPLPPGAEQKMIDYFGREQWEAMQETDRRMRAAMDTAAGIRAAAAGVGADGKPVDSNDG
jgi:transcriptional regulator with XRE-family HTH domain